MLGASVLAVAVGGGTSSSSGRRGGSLGVAGAEVRWGGAGAWLSEGQGGLAGLRGG